MLIDIEWKYLKRIHLKGTYKLLDIFNSKIMVGGLR